MLRHVVVKKRGREGGERKAKSGGEAERLPQGEEEEQQKQEGEEVVEVVAAAAPPRGKRAKTAAAAAETAEEEPQGRELEREQEREQEQPDVPVPSDVEGATIPIQKHLHEKVGYARKGKSRTAAATDGASTGRQRTLAPTAPEITPAERRVYQFVRRHCAIPEDFDLRHEFGPLSGCTYEQRVICAYQAGALEPKDEEHRQLIAGVKVCVACGETGHDRNVCPTLA